MARARQAAILQHTAEYIDTLEQEKTRLLAIQCQLKKVVAACHVQNVEIDGVDHQLVKRIKTEHTAESNNSDSSDEGIQCHPSPNGVPAVEHEQSVDELRAELVEVRRTVDRERKLRMQLEEQVKMLESQLYPERVKEIAQQVQVKFSEVSTRNICAAAACLLAARCVSFGRRARCNARKLVTSLTHSVLTRACFGDQSRQGVSSQVNSESEEAAAVASLVDDEVIAETIEIETHSCPGSPLPGGQPTTILIAPTSGAHANGDSLANTTRIIQVSDPTDVSRIPKTSSKAQQPAAIALPIDMPFIGAAANGTVTLQIVDANEQTVNASNTSRHNLETIVEAIRHLEGDHLFKDEDASVVKQEFVSEEIVATADEEVELRTSEPSATTKTVKRVVVSPEQLGTAIRQRNVIQCVPVSSSPSRPGVIVAKNQ